MLTRARSHPSELVLALDANADGMREASRRASSNALFLVCAAEAIPAELDGVADLLTIHFPWGSLLSGVTGAAPEFTVRLAGLVAPSGAVRLLVASAERDGGRGQPDLDPERVARAWESHGLRVTGLRSANVADAVAAHSSWGKRLLRNPGPGRSAWHIRLERAAVGEGERTRIGA